MTGTPPRLPAFVEFTPGQIGGEQSMFKLLEMAETPTPRADVVEKVREQWFSTAAAAHSDAVKRLQQQQRRAGNVLSGMRSAGLLNPDERLISLSDTGTGVLSAFRSAGAKSGLEEFVSFLLRERNGIELIHIAQFVMARDSAVSQQTINDELKFRGYASTTHPMNATRMKKWFETVGLVDRVWNVDEQVFATLAGLSASDISEWTRLTELQREALVSLRLRAEGDRTPIAANDLTEMLRQRGLRFNGSQLSQSLWKPLVAGGWVVQTVLTGGRGGKAGVITPTAKTLGLDVEKLAGLQLGELPSELQEQLGRPLPDIIRDLKSADTHIKGIALELLSLRIAVECGLFPVGFRLRAQQVTGGGEVDLVAEGAHLHFSRWLFQCKNTGNSVGLEVLAKEIGMATLLRAHVVVIVTTAKFRRTVREYAQQASATTAIQIILIDGELLKKYATKGPAALRQQLHQHALNALTLKRPQLDEVPSEAD